MNITDIGTSDPASPDYSRLQVLSFPQADGTATHYCANEDTATGTALLEEISETDAIVCATQIQSTCSILGS